jgi:hypothetical protein
MLSETKHVGTPFLRKKALSYSDTHDLPPSAVLTLGLGKGRGQYLQAVHSVGYWTHSLEPSVQEH